MLFYQYTGFFAIPQAPEWLPRADNSHIVYVSVLDGETCKRYHKFRKYSEFSFEGDDRISW